MYFAVRERAPDPPVRTNVLVSSENNMIHARWIPGYDLLPTDSANGTFVNESSRLSMNDVVKEYSVKPVPSHLKKKYEITDKASLDRAIQEGLVVHIESTPIDVSPDGHNRLDTRPHKSPMDLPQLYVLYRGTSHFHNQPLMPELYQKIGMIQNVFRIKSS